MKKCKRLVYLTVIFLFSMAVNAAEGDFEKLLRQFEAAETVENANKLFKLLDEEEFTNTLLHYDAQTPVDTLRAEVWYLAAEYLHEQQQYKKAAEYGEKAVPLLKGHEDEPNCLILLSIIYTRLTDYPNAVKYAKLCYALDEKNGDLDAVSSDLNTLAGIYMSAHQPKEAEKYILKGLELAEQSSNPSRKAVLLGMASEVYHSLGDHRQSLDFAEKAYQMEKELGRDDKMLLRLSQKSSALIGLHEYKQAEQVLKHVIPALRKLGDTHSLAIADNKMGIALHHQKREAEAVPYFREAAQIMRQMGDMANEMQARRGLYECLWSTQPDSAKVELERFNALKDSLYNNASADCLAKYNAELDNDWLQKEHEAKQRILMVGIAVALALLLLAAAIWWVMSRRHKRQREINQELTADINELREKYRQLSIDYNQSIAASQEQKQEDTLSTADREFLNNTINTINTMMLNGQVDAEGVARQLGMSLYQFRQRLNSVTGEKPQDFITILRMKRAQHLLDNHPELNIAEIAVLCAYNDTPNFTRAFKKYFSMTPTQYLSQKNG